MFEKLDEFYKSEENQKKYGFRYIVVDGIGSIYYDGDIDELTEIAYKSAGWIRVAEKNVSDSQNVISFHCNEGGLIVVDGSQAVVTAEVDGKGTEPNFLLRFKVNDSDVVIRFCMEKPQLYPDNGSYSYSFDLKSLSIVNEIFQANYFIFIDRWNTLRPDMATSYGQIPNYRAIKRIKS